MDKKTKRLEGFARLRVEPTRRVFLGTATAGALTAALGAPGCATEEGLFSIEALPEVIDDGTRSRVVRVVDPAATTWQVGDSWENYYQYGDQAVVDRMFDDGLMALSDAATVAEAWRALIPYQEGELVAVHLNAYCNDDNNAKNNVSHPTSALVRGLVEELGVPPERIAVVDSSRRLRGTPAEERLIAACRYTDSLLWDHLRGEYVEEPVPFTEGHDPGEPLKLSRVFDEADHLITVPILSWHGGNWITGALKTMMGEYQGHGAMHRNTTGFLDWANGARLADLCLPIRDKLRLVVGEGLFGNIIDNSSPPHAFQTLGGEGGQHPSSAMYFTRDMVSMDSVMYDDLIDEAEAAGRPKRGCHIGYLGYAIDAAHQLGRFEMRHVTGKGTYDVIELVEV